MNMLYKFFVLFIFVTPLMANESSSDHPKFFDTTGFSPSEMHCYGRAMIGFDSVINARAGINPINAYPIKNKLNGQDLTNEEIELAVIVFSAFLWTGSPHTYAIKTFGKCMIRSN